MKTITTEQLKETTGGYGAWGAFARASAFADAINGYPPPAYAYGYPPPPAYGYGYYGWRGRYWR